MYDHKQVLYEIMQAESTWTALVEMGQLGAADSAMPIRRRQLGDGTTRRSVSNGDIDFQCNFVCISPVML